jgi:broad specificity phosphatase PhoE
VDGVAGGADGGRLILVRHGESEGNRARRFTANPQVPLTDTGRDQARARAARLAQQFRPVRLIASPYTRAAQTAAIFSPVFDLAIETEPDLRGQSFGRLAGEPYASRTSDSHFAVLPRWEWVAPGGESLLGVRARAAPVLDRLMEGSPPGDVVVVSHGGVMVALCAHVSGGWDGLTVAPNCGAIVIEHQAGVYGTPYSVD